MERNKITYFEWHVRLHGRKSVFTIFVSILLISAMIWGVGWENTLARVISTTIGGLILIAGLIDTFYWRWREANNN